MVDTKDLQFFHGTCADAADSILFAGACDPFDQLRARELVREIWPIILESAGSFPEVANLFVRAGSEYPIGAPVGLQNVFDSNATSTFSYGAFYVSIGLEKAASYAFRGRDGSELLLFIDEALKVIRMLDPGLNEKLRASYPELTAKLELTPHPVVLELRGVEASRLLDENGGPPSLSLIELALEIQDSGAIIAPSFRVEGVAISDITAVYDLKGLAPVASSFNSIENCKMIPSNWILSRSLDRPIG